MLRRVCFTPPDAQATGSYPKPTAGLNSLCVTSVLFAASTPDGFPSSQIHFSASFHQSRIAVRGGFGRALDFVSPVQSGRDGRIVSALPIRNGDLHQDLRHAKKANRAESFGDFEMRRRALFGGPPKAGLCAPQSSATQPPSVSSDVSSAVEKERERPPFRFALTDPNGIILMGGDQYKKGDKAPAALFTQGKPIVVNGKTVAFALPNP